MRVAILIAIAFTLSACVSQQERDAGHATRCEQFGFQRGTEAFSSCLMQQDSDWKREQEAWMLRSKMSLQGKP
ncbi:hypothetical protein [Bosea sp. (in: a-proteobacteria)]|uniref:hypothetical protein n=1 Tax=Bosea sp. (in: a-proteobacteria) TaxID=1871050 RepID=UPI003B3ABA87